MQIITDNVMSTHKTKLLVAGKYNNLTFTTIVLPEPLVMFDEPEQVAGFTQKKVLKTGLSKLTDVETRIMSF